MVASEVEFYNLALSAIGTRKQVAVPTEVSREAEICRLWFPTIRDHVLRAAPWACAKEYTRLALLATQATDRDWEIGDPEPGFNFAYSLPANHLWPRHLTTFARFTLGQIGNVNCLMTNEEDAILVHTKQQTIYSRYDADLVLAVSYGLAATIARPLHGKTTNVQESIRLANDAILRARETSANEDFYEIEAIPSWLSARGIGGPTYPNRFIYPVGPMLSVS